MLASGMVKLEWSLSYVISYHLDLTIKKQSEEKRINITINMLWCGDK